MSNISKLFSIKKIPRFLNPQRFINKKSKGDDPNTIHNFGANENIYFLKKVCKISHKV